MNPLMPVEKIWHKETICLKNNSLIHQMSTIIKKINLCKNKIVDTMKVQLSHYFTTLAPWPLGQIYFWNNFFIYLNYFLTTFIFVNSNGQH